VNPASPSELREDTVEALLENVKGFLAAEDARAQSFISRGSGLAAFAGLIVSLSALLGRELIVGGIGGRLEVVAVAMYGLALGALVATVGAVVFGVLWPRAYDTIAMDEIERYPLPEFVYERRVMVQGRTLRGLVVALASERRRNSKKATWLKFAYLSLTAALVMAAGAAATLGLDEAMSDSIRQNGPRSAKPSTGQPSPFPKPIIGTEEKGGGGGKRR
jgi:hypothetical protein